MASDSDDRISNLNKIIETLKDGEYGHLEGAKDAESQEVKTLLQDASAQRAKFAAELQAEVRRLGGDPDQSGSSLGLAHRGWFKVKSALTGNKDHAVLEESERGDDYALKIFHDMLDKGVPQDVETIVRRQYDAVREMHDRIRALRDRVAVKA
jgi:uncharacterized protein (TIGR02284 family)